MRFALLMLLVGGCRQVFGIDTPALSVDSGGQSALDGRAPSDAPDRACLAQWHAHTIVFDPPTLVVSTMANARAPVVAPDQLQIWFAQSSHIYTASRGSIAMAFGPVVAFAPAASQNNSIESKVAFSADQLSMVVASNRSTQQSFDLFRATRSAPAAAFGALVTGPFATYDDASAQTDPWVNEDASIVYFVSGGTLLREQLSDLQAMTIAVGAVSPTLLDGERVLVYANAEGVTSYRTRESFGDAFGQEYQLPPSGIDPTVSADGCQLYFASVNAGNQSAIYQANVRL